MDSGLREMFKSFINAPNQLKTDQAIEYTYDSLESPKGPHFNNGQPNDFQNTVRRNRIFLDQFQKKVKAEESMAESSKLCSERRIYS